MFLFMSSYEFKALVYMCWLAFNPPPQFSRLGIQVSCTFCVCFCVFYVDLSCFCLSEFHDLLLWVVGLQWLVDLNLCTCFAEIIIIVQGWQ